MDKRKRIILLGDSLVIAGIRASLTSNNNFEVFNLNVGIDLRNELFASQANIVIFETTLLQTNMQEILMQYQPHALLIGIDPSSNHVLLLEGKRMSDVSLNDLVEIIQNQS